MRFLETNIFQEWLVITVIFIALMFLRRHKIKEQFQTGIPPQVDNLLILAILLVILNLRANPTGDEPHYLLITQSLLRDGDFDLRNNYEQMDYLEYYPTTIPDPHVTIVGDRWLPVHEIGLPIIMVPFFALGGRTGVVIMLVLMTVIGIRSLWFFVRSAGFGLRAAGFATLVSGFTLPLISLSGQVFPEVPAFLLVTLGLQTIIGTVLTGRNFVIFLISLVFLPWLHPKYMIVAFALLLSAVLIHHKSATRSLVIASGLFIASVLGLVLLTYQWYGVPLPGAPIMMAQAPFGEDWLAPLLGNFFVKPWVGLTGVLLDQQSGLFMATPVFILAIPGLVSLWYQKRKLAIVCAIIFASVYLPVGIFGVWYGGFSSPARLLTPAVPILALGIANMLDVREQRVWKFFSILALPSLLHAYLMMTLPSFTRYGDPTSQHNYFISLFEHLTHLDLTILFPTFRNIDPTTWLTTGIYLSAILAITIFLVPPKVAEHRNKTQHSSQVIL
ncbi:MAG TPA: hypothetical protein VK206_23710 [Anaerolineales bacterium]|nr:hypothetical protein [Anaerolineales bacterium]HLO30384.1 hypothetical protein [Anaerolineales bacterium]